MLVFSGILAAGFYSFLIGTIWPANRSETLSEALIGYWAKSIWFSWFIVFVSYLLDLPNLLWPLLILVVGVHCFWAMNRRFITVPGTLPLLATWVVLLAVPAVLLVGTVFKGWVHHSLIFSDWDAVVSWNRWAIELSGNRYAPHNAAYPVLFPALWSLVYKAQGDASVWIIAKLTLFALPFLLVLSAISLIERRRLAAGILVVVFSLLFFWYWHGDYLFTGYMDSPVAVLTLLAGVAILLALDAPARVQWGGHLSTASLLVALASITKQAGVLLLLPFVALLVIERVRGRCTTRGAMLQLVLAVTPLITFMVMFLSTDRSPIGNLEYLSTLSDQAADGSNHYLSAVVTLLDPYPRWFILSLLGIALANLMNLRRPAGIMGTVLLGSAILGAAVYADCCSYSTRNGWWIIVLLLLSAAFALGALDKWLTGRLKTDGMAALNFSITPSVAGGVLLAIAALVSIAIPDGRAREIQNKYLWQIGTPAVNALLREHRSAIGRDVILISPYQLSGWLPEIGDNYRLCHGGSAACVAEISATTKTLLLVGAGPGLDYAELGPVIAQGRRLGEASGWELFGPFEAGELTLP